jgi:putative glutamine amidotransferase
MKASIQFTNGKYFGGGRVSDAALPAEPVIKAKPPVAGDDDFDPRDDAYDYDDCNPVFDEPARDLETRAPTPSELRYFESVKAYEARKTKAPKPKAPKVPKAPKAPKAPEALQYSGPRPQVILTGGSFGGDIERRITALGGEVLFVRTVAQAQAAKAKATHLFLPGGADIHPAYYNQKIRGAHPFDDARDAVEYDLADWALANKIPTMAVCRGHQMITVAAGGTLYQDLYQDAAKRHDKTLHLAIIRKGSRLQRDLGMAHTKLVVNSYHHQATDKVPDGWFVAAVSSDGVVESIAHPHLPVISVQWHPEAQYTREAWHLFSAWLQMKKGNRK